MMSSINIKANHYELIAIFLIYEFLTVVCFCFLGKKYPASAHEERWITWWTGLRARAAWYMAYASIAGRGTSI